MAEPEKVVPKGATYSLDLPIRVNIGGPRKDRWYAINLNNYRNAHHHSNNKAKIKFKEVIQHYVDKLPLLGKVVLDYWLYMPSQRDSDTNNVCTIVDKFFLDALVESGKLVDDNHRIVVGSGFYFGGYDKANPRVTVYIKEVEMKLTQTAVLDEQDIAKALGLFLRHELNIDADTEISLSVPQGLNVVAYIGNGEVLGTIPAETVKEAPKPRGRRKAAVVETATVEEVTEETTEAKEEAANALDTEADAEDAGEGSSEESEEEVSLLSGPADAPKAEPEEEQFPEAGSFSGLFAKKAAAPAPVEEAEQVGGSNEEVAPSRPVFSFKKN